MTISATQVKELRDRTGAGMMECKRALVDAGGDIEAAVEAMRKSGQAKADKKAGRITAEGLIGLRMGASGDAAALVEVNCETDFVAKEAAFREFVETVAARVLEARTADPDALGALALEADAGGTTIEERRRELIAKIGENITVRRLAVMETGEGRIGAYLHGGRIGVLVEIRGGDADLAKDIAMHVAASRPLAVSQSDIAPDVLAKERDILRAQVAESGKPPEIQEKMLTGRVSKYLKEVTLLGQPFVKDPDVSVEKHLQASGANVVRFLRLEVGEGVEKKSEDFASEVMAQVRGA